MRHFAMASIVDLRIAELLAARLCHELVGPVTAVENGVELLLDQDPGLDREALTLVAESAARAGSRLQFYRFAYGFGGEGEAAGPPPFELAAGYFTASRITCDYHERVRRMPLARQRLACNLLLTGAQALARGGTLLLGEDDAGNCGLRLDAAGEAAQLAPEQRAALALEAPLGALAARTVQAYFTGLVARTQGLDLVASTLGAGRLRISSMPAA
jgi:histidine phosphotransferase ChpT